jgi:4-hydroxybenzoate polyprenyltransferase
MAVATLSVGPLVRYAWCIRYRELFFLQGTPLLGVLFAAPPLTPVTLARIALFGLAGFLLLAHTFTFNDWAEFAADLQHPDKAASLAARDATRRELGLLAAGLLAGALLLFGLLSPRTLFLASLLVGLGALYSHPATHGKAVPIASSALHLAAGVLHFLLGYSLYGGLDLRGALIGLFFALTFTAGHLNQEVRDYEGDALAGLRTNAVTFGKTPTFLAGFGLFTLAYAHLVLLASLGVIPRSLAWLGLLYLVHLAWSLRTLRGGLTFDTLTRFQAGYRALYALIGLAMLAALLLG